MAESVIAKVAVDLPLSHLDHPFDYLVPDKYLADAKIGVRVLVTIQGKTHNGFIVDLATDSQIPKNRLIALTKVVSGEVVLTPEQIGFAQLVADHCCGSFMDVVRLMVPARHKQTEQLTQQEWPAPNLAGGAIPASFSGNPKSSQRDLELTNYPNGSAFLAALKTDICPRGFWQVVPSQNSWIAGFAEATRAVVAAGKSAIVTVSQVSQAKLVKASFDEIFGARSVAILHSELSNAARYRNYLAVSRGEAKILVGTRQTLYAPMKNLGLIALWDDADPSFEEGHAPYPKSRDVAALRASFSKTALLFASWSRSIEMQHWLAKGWLNLIAYSPATVRKICPWVKLSNDSDFELEKDPLAGVSRIPSQAFEVIRTGLKTGPVLVQVARAGYHNGLFCGQCREKICCPKCANPMREVSERQAGQAIQRISCSVCGFTQLDFCCPNCSATKIRGVGAGATRTAEELSRAFPGYKTIDSSRDNVLERIPDAPVLVVATKGGEPVADSGYSAAVILDTAASLNQADFRAGEKTLRSIMNVVARVRRGGRIYIVGDSQDRVLQAVVRMDPGSLANTELAERNLAHFPPAYPMATVTGDQIAVERIHEIFTQLTSSEVSAAQPLFGENQASCQLDAEIFGPYPQHETRQVTTQPTKGVGDGEKIVQVTYRVPASQRGQLCQVLKQAQRQWAAKKPEGSLKVRID